MYELGTISSMTSEQKNSSAPELIRDRVSDSRDNLDRSRIKSPKSRNIKAVVSCSSLHSTISNETFESLIALSNELKKVRCRLISEGYVIDGKHIYKPDEKGDDN